MVEDFCFGAVGSIGAVGAVGKVWRSCGTN